MLLDIFEFLTMDGDLCVGTRCRIRKRCLRYALYEKGTKNRLVMLSCIGHSKFRKCDEDEKVENSAQ